MLAGACQNAGWLVYQNIKYKRKSLYEKKIRAGGKASAPCPDDRTPMALH